MTTYAIADAAARRRLTPDQYAALEAGDALGLTREDIEGLATAYASKGDAIDAMQRAGSGWLFDSVGDTTWVDITDDQIRELREGADQARDDAQIGICDLALGEFGLLERERQGCYDAAVAQGYDGTRADYALTVADVESIRGTLGRGFAASEVEYLDILDTPDADVTRDWAREECRRVIAAAQGV